MGCQQRDPQFNFHWKKTEENQKQHSLSTMVWIMLDLIDSKQDVTNALSKGSLLLQHTNQSTVWAAINICFKSWMGIGLSFVLL